MIMTRTGERQKKKTILDKKEMAEFVPHPGSIHCIWVVLQHAGQSKVRHFTHQISIYQNVSCCKVSVHIVHFREILHPRSNATHHAQKLNHCKLAIMFLYTPQYRKKA